MDSDEDREIIARAARRAGERSLQNSLRNFKHLAAANVCFDAPNRCWRLELCSSDGGCWPIGQYDSEEAALAQGRMFEEFSGLRLLLRGEVTL